MIAGRKYQNSPEVSVLQNRISFELTDNDTLTAPARDE
jgi:hypothetical protein